MYQFDKAWLAHLQQPTNSGNGPDRLRGGYLPECQIMAIVKHGACGEFTATTDTNNPGEMSMGERTVIDSEVIEKAIRAAVSSIPGIGSMHEKDYVDCYLEAIDVIKDGLEMRQDELG